MNFNAKHKGVNWRKIIPVALVLLIAGYIAGRPQLEKIFGVSLPALGEEDPGQDNDGERIATTDRAADSGSNGSGDYSINFDENQNSGAQNSPTQEVVVGENRDGILQTFDLEKVQSAGFAIHKTGNTNYTSPAGLVYTMGPRQEHRIDHVLRHSADQPDRQGSHGVFDGDTVAILKMLDDAYLKIKNESSDVRIESTEGNRVAYSINFKRRIGYRGGQSGNRQNHPQLKILKLILQSEDRVVSAFPLR